LLEQRSARIICSLWGLARGLFAPLTFSFNKAKFACSNARAVVPTFDSAAQPARRSCFNDD
jgi:hypothetical protein